MMGMNEGEIILTAIGISMILISMGVCFLMIVKAFRGGANAGATANDDDETRMIQEIYHGLSKMEDRIETLETLLIEGERKRSEAQKLREFDRNIERG